MFVFFDRAYGDIASVTTGDLASLRILLDFFKTKRGAFTWHFRFEPTFSSVLYILDPNPTATVNADSEPEADQLQHILLQYNPEAEFEQGRIAVKYPKVKLIPFTFFFSFTTFAGTLPGQQQ